MNKKNKLLDQAQDSKLNQINQLEKEQVTFLANKKNSPTRSFRLDNQGWKELEEIVERVNLLKKKPTNKNRIVRALIYLGNQMDDKRILKALKEVAE